MTLRWQTEPGKRYRYANARPDKLGTYPKAVDGIDKGCRGKRSEEENSASKHHIQSECRE